MYQQLAPTVGPQAAQSIITIQKARIKDHQLTCEFTEQRDQDAPARAFTLTSQEFIHSDLQHRLASLIPHFCLLCEQLTETPDYWPDDEAGQLPAHFDNFSVTGLSIGRGGGGVTLIGQRRLAGNRVLNLTSPYVAYDAETGHEYSYTGLLESALRLSRGGSRPARQAQRHRPPTRFFRTGKQPAAARSSQCRPYRSARHRDETPQEQPKKRCRIKRVAE